METAEVASAVSLRLLKPTISNDYLKFLGDFEAICETAFFSSKYPISRKKKIRHLMEKQLYSEIP
jgi:hypothetical protein